MKIKTPSSGVRKGSEGRKRRQRARTTAKSKLLIGPARAMRAESRRGERRL